MGVGCGGRGCVGGAVWEELSEGRGQGRASQRKGLSERGCVGGAVFVGGAVKGEVSRGAVVGVGLCVGRTG